MSEHVYGGITKLEGNLRNANIDQGIIDQILQGGNAITNKTSPEKRIGWLREAMVRMDELLDIETRRSVREGCACCLGGKREEIVKAIARQCGTLEEHVKAANESPFVFGHSVTLLEDGRIRVAFYGDQPSYRCACLPKAKEPLPITYCFCCGGHVKHHLQIALGRKLTCDVRTSALASGGTQPCTFVLTVVE